MLVKTYGAAVNGIDATQITIEVNVMSGIERYVLVGLPDNAVKESYERVRSALTVSGCVMPRNVVVVNMAPADIRKEGSAYDLPIAIGIAGASGGLHDTQKLGRWMMMGELGLDGGLKPIRGILPIAIMARGMGYEGLIVPQENAKEAAVVNKLKIVGAGSLKQVVDFMNGVADLPQTIVDTRKEFSDHINNYDVDFADVKGQESVKRAFEIAAAGGHNIIMIGPPGAGKSMMAKRIGTILPPLTLQEALETTKIHSVAGLTGRDTSLVTQRPFRSPHHTISDVALIGGGTTPKPGEISIAHNGVLFLDELPEFSRHVLEVLRQPLEDRSITISRQKQSLTYPANFMLVASMNPCPCGYFNHPTRPCICTPTAVHKYMGKISGPLLDRIDIQVEIIPVPFEKLTERTVAESSAQIRERVIMARQRQIERYGKIEGCGIYSNAQMGSREIRQFCQPDDSSLELLRNAMQKLNLSARAYDRILKVARTIADLEGTEKIEQRHIAEAVGYRSLDRSSWGGM